MMRSGVVGLFLGGLVLPACAQRSIERPGETTTRTQTVAPARTYSAPQSNRAPSYADIRVSSFGIGGVPGNSAAQPRQGGDHRRSHEDAGAGFTGATVLVPPYVLSNGDGGLGNAGNILDQTSGSPAQQSDPAYAIPQGAASYPAPQPEPRPAAPIERAAPAQSAPDEPRYTASQAAPRTPPAPLQEQDAITVIFRDGRPAEQVRNYMLTRTTFYITDKKRREIPVELLDLPAMEKANREAGVSFRLPAAK